MHIDINSNIVIFSTKCIRVQCQTKSWVHYECFQHIHTNFPFDLAISKFIVPCNKPTEIYFDNIVTDLRNIERSDTQHWLWELPEIQFHLKTWNSSPWHCSWSFIFPLYILCVFVNTLHTFTNNIAIWVTNILYYDCNSTAALVISLKFFETRKQMLF